MTGPEGCEGTQRYVNTRYYEFATVNAIDLQNKGDTTASAELGLERKMEASNSCQHFMQYSLCAPLHPQLYVPLGVHGVFYHVVL